MPTRESMPSLQNDVWAINPLKDGRWVSLLASHPSASVFHTQNWLRALQVTYGYEPVAFTTSGPSEELTNAILFCMVRSWLTGCRFVALPFSDHCEPIVDNSVQLQRLLTHVEGLRKQDGWKYVELRSSNSGLDLGKQFSRATTYRLHYIDLRPPLDALLKAFHKDCIQRKISRAERESLRYEAGDSPQLIEQLYGLLQLTRSRHHIPPQPFEWFKNVVAIMGKDACIRVASKNGQPVAGIMTLNYGKTMVYKYGGSDTRFNNLGATPMLFWRAIQEAKADGIELMDLGRSDLDNLGLIAFKERWAADSATLTTWRAPERTASPIVERFKSRIAKDMCTLLPSPALTLVGRLLYRHIG